MRCSDTPSLQMRAEMDCAGEEPPHSSIPLALTFMLLYAHSG